MGHLSLLFLKIIVVSSLMLAVSLCARKWGGFIGGIFSGLPLTSAPVIFFLTIEQGIHFAEHAAQAALSGLVAVLATYLFYTYTTKYLSILAGCIISLMFFCATSAMLMLVSSYIFTIISSLVVVIAIIILTNKKQEKQNTSALSYRAVLLRILSSATLLVAITGLAEFLGSYWSGVLSPVPVIAWPFVVLTHINHGRTAMLGAVRGNAISAIGVIVFYIILINLLLVYDIKLAFWVAILSSVLVTILIISALMLIESHRKTHR